MQYSNFFRFSSKLTNNAVQVKAPSINEGIKIVSGTETITDPIIFNYKSGKRLYDLIDTGWPGLYLVTNIFFSALIQNNITGWKRYPCKIFDKSKNEIVGYSILAIVGRSGELKKSLSKYIWVDGLEPGFPRSKIRKGAYFDLNTWDGSDFFIPKKSLMIMITEKAKNIIEGLNLTNISIVPISDFESLVDVEDLN